MRLLLTRPAPDCEHTAALLTARGHEVIVAPLLRIEPLAEVDLGSGPWAAILVTSANAARAIARHRRIADLRGLPVLAVGERSAQAMRDAGFADVVSAGGGGGDLMRLAAARLKPGVTLLHIAGADRAGDIAGDLGAQNFAVSTVVIYRAVVAAALPGKAAAALAGGIDGVLHFSRRSAEAYVTLARAGGLRDQALRGPVHFCLSARIAEPLAQAGGAALRVAPQPTEAALLDLVPAP